MRSVADDLREEQRGRATETTAEERLALARALGERDLALFIAATGRGRAEAVRELRRRAQVGRNPSKVAIESA